MIPTEVTIAKSDRSDIFFIVIALAVTADNSIAATKKTYLKHSHTQNAESIELGTVVRRTSGSASIWIHDSHRSLLFE